MQFPKIWFYQKMGISFSWMGIALIMGLSMVGWFLIFHHVTFGLADMQYRKEMLIETEFERIESSNDEFINSLKETYQEGYISAAKGYHPKTLGKADTSIQSLVSKKFFIDQQTVNNKLNLLFEGNSFSNILLSYVARFRNTLGDTAAEILIWILAILLSGGIDVCGHGFNRVTKYIDNEEKEEDVIKEGDIHLFDDETEAEEFDDGDYILNNKDENVTEDVTPEIENDVTVVNGKMSQQKKTNIDKEIQKLIDNGNTNKTHIANKIKINGKSISRRTVQRFFKNKVNGESE